MTLCLSVGVRLGCETKAMHKINNTIETKRYFGALIFHSSLFISAFALKLALDALENNLVGLNLYILLQQH